MLMKTRLDYIKIIFFLFFSLYIMRVPIHNSRTCFSELLEMYFTRFKPDVLSRAIANETISTDEYCLVVDFYHHDKMRLSKEDYESLSQIFDVEILESVENLDYVVVHIRKYPWNKENCLHFAPSNPRHWKFFDEMYETSLFDYIVGVPCGRLIVNSTIPKEILYEQPSILGPTAVSPDNSFHASGHGFD